MIRRNVHITERQLGELDKISKRSGLRIAEIIRRALDEYLKKMKREEGK